MSCPHMEVGWLSFVFVDSSLGLAIYTSTYWQLSNTNGLQLMASWPATNTKQACWQMQWLFTLSFLLYSLHFPRKKKKTGEEKWHNELWSMDLGWNTMVFLSLSSVPTLALVDNLLPFLLSLLDEKRRKEKGRGTRKETDVDVRKVLYWVVKRSPLLNWKSLS